MQLPRSPLTRVPSIVAMCLAVGALAASAQTPVTVQGRVYATDSGAGIQNAVVTLEGYGSALTSALGSFRFDDVVPGERTLRVEAFGYGDVTLTLSVESSTTVDVPLEPEALVLDSVRVDLETLDFDGRAVDADKDLRLVDAEVVSSQGHREWTDAHGNFDLDDAYEEVPLRVVIRAFGYLPFDTTLVPHDERRHAFALTSDSLMQRMIEVQVDRIVDVTTGRRATAIRSMDREAVLGFAGTFTLYDMLLSEYRYRLDRVRCIVVDEEQIPYQRDWMSYLGTMLPEEVERVDFMFRGAMLRIYTRDFVQRMAMSSVSLKEPSYFGVPSGEPLCR